MSLRSYHFLFSFKPFKMMNHGSHIFFSLLENQKLHHSFFSVLTLGLKKDDMGFMPLLSTFARLF